GSAIQHGSQGGNVKLGFNAPLGEIAAVRASAYFNALGGYIDSPGIKTLANGSIEPDPTTTQKHVNTGKRFGGRIAVTFAPTDRLTITPRFLYQQTEMDRRNPRGAEPQARHDVHAGAAAVGHPEPLPMGLGRFLRPPEPRLRPGPSRHGLHGNQRHSLAIIDRHARAAGQPLLLQAVVQAGPVR